MSSSEGGLRRQIGDLITALDPYDDREAQDRAKTLAWIESGAELFRRVAPATPPRHLVSYFLLVDEGHMLLVDHIKAGLWLPSGGHVEPGEHPRETVEREVQEELGVAASLIGSAPYFLTIQRTTGTHDSHEDVSLWYMLQGDRNHTYDYDRSEFNRIAWFAAEDAPFERTDPNLRRFLMKTGL